METDPNDDINREAFESDDAEAKAGANQSTSRVGYKNPPHHSRFKKGQSGNRKGRPRAASDIRTILETLLREQIRVRDGGKTRRISTSDALAQVLIRGTMMGKTGAFNVLMFIEETLGVFKPLYGDDKSRYGYLVAPPKLSLDEWQKQARRALAINLKEMAEAKAEGEQPHSVVNDETLSEDVNQPTAAGPAGRTVATPLYRPLMMLMTGEHVSIWSGPVRTWDVTPYTLRKCLIFLGCDGVTSFWQYDRHAASNWVR